MQNMPFSKNREIYFLQHPNPKIHTNGKADDRQQEINKVHRPRSVKEQSPLWRTSSYNPYLLSLVLSLAP